MTEHDSDKFTRQGTVERRLPIIAALMGAMLPGFGQLYNGQANRAVWFFLIFIILTVPVAMVIALYLPASLMVGVLAVSVVLSLGVWVWGIIDAWRVARRSNAYRPKPWQTSGLYAAVFVLCGLIILPLCVITVRHFQVEPFRIPSTSMSPTLQPGDFLFTNKSYNCPSLCREAVKHGDVSVFVYPNNRTQHFIKRIIGLPGDTVVASNGIVSINGKALAEVASTDGQVIEKYNDREWSVAYQDRMADFSVTVEPGHVFVLGDNRSKSNDSRFFGQVPLADVVGKARQIWFSKNKEGIQWDRIGATLNP